jgi:hypothetical protein
MKRSDRRSSREHMRIDAEARTRQTPEQRRGMLGTVDTLADNAFPAGDLVVDDRGRERALPRDDGGEPRRS